MDIEEMSKQSWLVGVDPGSSYKDPAKAGQCCFLNESFTEVYFIPCFERDEIRKALSGLKDVILWCAIEEVASFFGKPHGDYCRWLERLESLKIRHSSVHPAIWQKSLGEHRKTGAKGSIDFIVARHPEFVENIKNVKRGYNSNKSDAFVLAMYAEKFVRPKVVK